MIVDKDKIYIPATPGHLIGMTAIYTEVDCSNKIWSTIFARHVALVRMHGSNHGCGVKTALAMFACDCIPTVCEQEGIALDFERT